MGQCVVPASSGPCPQDGCPACGLCPLSGMCFSIPSEPEGPFPILLNGLFVFSARFSVGLFSLLFLSVFELFGHWWDRLLCTIEIASIFFHSDLDLKLVI